MRAKQERRGQPAPIRDPAGGDHRHRRHRIDDRRQQCERAEGAGVPARFTALGDDDVDSGLRGRHRLLQCLHLGEDPGASSMGRRDEGRRIGERVIDRRDPFFQRDRASSAVSGKEEMKPTPKGRAVSDRAIRI